MASLLSFPFLKLPPELQGHILEYAADSNSGKASSLALISRFAAQYVQPRIFCKVCLGKSSGFEALKPEDIMIPKSLAEGFLALHVKHLCITGAVLGDYAATFLSACTGVIDLVLWSDLLEASEKTTIKDRQGRCAKLLHPLPLQRLSCRYDLLWHVEAFPGPLPQPWFQTLTHLDIYYDHVEDIEQHFIVPLLEHLTSLTHLGLTPDAVHGNTFSESGLLAVLKSRPSLQILLVQVLLWELLQELLEKPWADPRIVYRLELTGDEAIEDWEAHWEGTPTMWTEAEEVVLKRRPRIPDG